MKKFIFKTSLVVSLVFLAFLSFQSKAQAYTFDPNNLIADSVFTNYTSMSAAQIDSFLNSFSSSCLSTHNGFTTPDPQGWSDSQNKYLFGGNVSAGTALQSVANLYHVNPQVLLATLQKEQSLVSGGAGCHPSTPNPNWPASSTPAANKTFTCTISGKSQKCTYACTYSGGCMNIAMGYGCPSYCAAADEGFSMQITLGTWLLRFGQQRSFGNLTGYAGYETGDENFTYTGPMTQGVRKRSASSTAIYYNGNYTTSNSVTVQIESGGTASLYNFTPFTSGNQNFDNIFASWFGSPAVDTGKDMPLSGDWDHGGKSTAALKRGNVFYIDNNNDGIADTTFTYGKSTDVALVGDWNGDGSDSIALKRGNVFYIDNNNDGIADTTFTYGKSTDVALVGDWNGDGSDSIALKRGNVFYIDNNNDGIADTTFTYGKSTDVALVGDWNGDGSDSIALKRGNVFYIDNNNDGIADTTFTYGKSTDVALVGDWNGDGSDSIALKRGNVFYIDNNNDGIADTTFTYGKSTDVALVGDWNGDGSDSIALKRGSYFYLDDGNNGTTDVSYLYTY